MKYKDADFSKWDQVPSEEVFNDWCKVRKSKMTQSALNRTAPHINKLYQAGISADESLCIACERCWTGIKYQWVMKEIARDMDSLSDSFPVQQPRLNRDIPIAELVTDRSWAD